MTQDIFLKEYQHANDLLMDGKTKQSLKIFRKLHTELTNNPNIISPEGIFDPISESYTMGKAMFYEDFRLALDEDNDLDNVLKMQELACQYLDQVPNKNFLLYIYFNLSSAYLEQMRYHDSLKMSLKAVTCLKNGTQEEYEFEGLIYTNAGICSFFLGDILNAKSLLLKAEELDQEEEYFEIYYFLYLIYEETDIKKSENYLQKLIDILPDDPEEIQYQTQGYPPIHVQNLLIILEQSQQDPE